MANMFLSMIKKTQRRLLIWLTNYMLIWARQISWIQSEKRSTYLTAFNGKKTATKEFSCSLMDLLTGKKKIFLSLHGVQTRWDSTHLVSEMTVIRTWWDKWQSKGGVRITSSEMTNPIWLVQRSLMRYKKLLSQALVAAQSPSSLESI